VFNTRFRSQTTIFLWKEWCSFWCQPGIEPIPLHRLFLDQTIPCFPPLHSMKKSEEGSKNNKLYYRQVQRINNRSNHNYIKILKSDWSSAALIWAVIVQLYASCLSNWTVRVMKLTLVALEWVLFQHLA